MKTRDLSEEALRRDERTGNAGVCPACHHKLRSATWFSLLLPNGKEERVVACPWCVDLDALVEDGLSGEVVDELRALVAKYRRPEP